MTKLIPDERCQLCGGMLVPPNMLPPRDWPYPDKPDYVCKDCDQPFWWRGNPPKLSGITGT